MKFTPKDSTDLRKHIEIAVQAALATWAQEAGKGKHVTKIHSSNLMHTPLSPDGDTFTVQLAMEVHEKPGEEQPK